MLVSNPGNTVTFGDGFAVGSVDEDEPRPHAVASASSVATTARLRIEYETNAVSAHLDRITTLQLGGTNASGVPAGGMISYAYQILGAAGSNDFLTAVFQTTVTDRNGNLTEYQFNQLGNIVRGREFSNRDVRPSDPVYFETRYEYNADGEMTRAISPEGNYVTYVYDTANLDRFPLGRAY